MKDERSHARRNGKNSTSREPCSKTNFEIYLRVPYKINPGGGSLLYFNNQFIEYYRAVWIKSGRNKKTILARTGWLGETLCIGLWQHDGLEEAFHIIVFTVKPI